MAHFNESIYKRLERIAFFVPFFEDIDTIAGRRFHISFGWNNWGMYLHESTIFPPDNYQFTDPLYSMLARIDDNRTKKTFAEQNIAIKDIFLERMSNKPDKPDIPKEIINDAIKWALNNFFDGEPLKIIESYNAERVNQIESYDGNPNEFLNFFKHEYDLAWNHPFKDRDEYELKATTAYYIQNNIAVSAYKKSIELQLKQCAKEKDADLSTQMFNVSKSFQADEVLFLLVCLVVYEKKNQLLNRNAKFDEIQKNTFGFFDTVTTIKTCKDFCKYFKHAYELFCTALLFKKLKDECEARKSSRLLVFSNMPSENRLQYLRQKDMESTLNYDDSDILDNFMSLDYEQIWRFCIQKITVDYSKSDIREIIPESYLIDHEDSLKDAIYKSAHLNILRNLSAKIDVEYEKIKYENWLNEKYKDEEPEEIKYTKRQEKIINKLNKYINEIEERNFTKSSYIEEFFEKNREEFKEADIKSLRKLNDLLGKRDPNLQRSWAGVYPTFSRVYKKEFCEHMFQVYKQLQEEKILSEENFRTFINAFSNPEKLGGARVRKSPSLKDKENWNQLLVNLQNKYSSNKVTGTSSFLILEYPKFFPSLQITFSPLFQPIENIPTLLKEYPLVLGPLDIKDIILDTYIGHDKSNQLKTTFTFSINKRNRQLFLLEKIIEGKESSQKTYGIDFYRREMNKIRNEVNSMIDNGMHFRHKHYNEAEEEVRTKLTEFSEESLESLKKELQIRDNACELFSQSVICDMCCRNMLAVPMLYNPDKKLFDLFWQMEKQGNEIRTIIIPHRDVEISHEYGSPIPRDELSREIFTKLNVIVSRSFCAGIVFASVPRTKFHLLLEQLSEEQLSELFGMIYEKDVYEIAFREFFSLFDSVDGLNIKHSNVSDMDRTREKIIEDKIRWNINNVVQNSFSFIIEMHPSLNFDEDIIKSYSQVLFRAGITLYLQVTANFVMNMPKISPDAEKRIAHGEFK